MPNVVANDAAAQEQARVRRWLLAAQKPRRLREEGGIVADYAGRKRWEREGGIMVRAPEMALMLAWIDSLLGLSDGRAPLDGLTDDEAHRQLSADERVRSAVLQVAVRAQGRVGLAAQVPEELDNELRRELLGPAVDDFVLGYADQAGEWVTGLAGLSDLEAEAFRASLLLRSHECRRPDKEHPDGMRCLFEIRDALPVRRRRKGERLAVETVENRLSAARGKLRRWADHVREQGVK